MTEVWQQDGFGLYLHWPFCQAKCPYCDFNSHVASDIDHDAWSDAYLKEIDRVAAETTDRVLRSVYFGGGTPSLMREATVHAILDRVAGSWRLANDLEVTLEANPGSVEAGRFRGYRLAGVNRVSLGLQALNDRDLRRLGRLHDAADARRALRIASDTFERVSFDLIYARQDQTLRDWESELREAISFGVGHMSLYQLTIEEGTVFARRFNAGTLRGIPQDDAAADMYEMTQSYCSEAGLPAYEVSNHARAGEEARHNLIYWRGGDYAGIGPGAHGRLTIDGRRWSTETARDPADWLMQVATQTAERRAELTLKDVALEQILMGLRLSEPFDLVKFSQRTGVTLNEGQILNLRELGMIEGNAQFLQVTAKGRPVLNAVISELVRDL